MRLSNWLKHAAAACALISASLASHADPILWVSTGGAQLATVDVATGTTSVIGSTSVALTDIAFSPTGDLYGISFSNLYTVNTSTGAATAIGSGIGFQSGGDLAFVGGDLFMASSGNQLIDVDVTTGAGVFVGNLGVGDMFGLATPDNVTLYGVAGQSVYLVNTGTGAATFQSTFNPTLSGGAFGLAFRTESGGGSVPEPGILALLALALAGLGFARRKLH